MSKKKKIVKPLASVLAEAKKEQDNTPINEPFCTKVRRLAKEAKNKENEDRETKKQAFLDSIFKPNEYVKNDDGTYTICGWRWQLWARKTDNIIYTYLTLNEIDCYQSNPLKLNCYRGELLNRQMAYDYLSLGQAMEHIDKEVADIDARANRTLWSKFIDWFLEK